MIITGKISIRRTAEHLGMPLICIFVLSVAVVIIRHTFEFRGVSTSAVPFTIIGAAISIYLAFRNNAVYDRYWEGRSLWGRMVNVSRNLTRQLDMFLTEDSPAVREYRRAMYRRMIAFAHSLRVHLRGEDSVPVLNMYLSEQEAHTLSGARNVPTQLQHLIGLKLREGLEQGWFNSYHMLALDESLTEMAAVQGSCERIKNTPLPPVYTYLTHKVVMMYCFALPVGLARELGWLTPIVSLVISFVFLVLERITELLEQPFGTRPNDLPLSALCRTIEIDLLQSLNAGEIPEPVKPVGGVLI